MFDKYESIVTLTWNKPYITINDLHESRSEKGLMDEISKAFTLHYFGKRGYTYESQKLKDQLPRISSLQT